MWQSVNDFAWHEDPALLASIVAAVGLLLIHYKSAERRGRNVASWQRRFPATFSG